MSQPGKLSALLSAACGEADPISRERAFDELMRLLTIFVRAGMGDALRRHRESMDVCQSVVKSFVADLDKGRLSFPNEQALVGYLQQVVRTKLAEAARHDAAWKRGGRADHAPIEGGGSGDAAKEPPSPEMSVSKVVTIREMEADAFAGLDGDEQELIRLRRAGMGWDQIGAALGKNPTALRKTWSRLQQRLGGEG